MSALEELTRRLERWSGVVAVGEGKALAAGLAVSMAGGHLAYAKGFRPQHTGWRSPPSIERAV
jgi:hypothetical protein